MHNTCAVYMYMYMHAYNSFTTELLKVIASFGNTKAVFVGHDHGNDWCCPFSEMLVCYGRHTGYGGYGRYTYCIPKYMY